MTDHTAALREALARLPKVRWAKTRSTVEIPETEDFAGKQLPITGLDKQYARNLAAYIAAANPAVIAEVLARLDAQPQPPKIDVEHLIRTVLPGGHSCDPQAVADDLRRYFDAWEPQQSAGWVPEEVRGALMDSQYLAGVTAGWNAAQADDPNAALKSIHDAYAGHLKPLRDWQKAGRPTAHPSQQEDDALDAARYRWLRNHFRFAADSSCEIWFDNSLEHGPADQLDCSIDAAISDSAGEGGKNG